MKGQLSAEMLILIAVILALVALVASQLMTTAEKTSTQINAQTDELLESTESYSKAKEGQFCVEDDDCLSDSCVDNACD